MPTLKYQIEVRFPSDAVVFVETPAYDVIQRLPDPNKETSQLSVHLRQHSRVDVRGFGMPFAHPGHLSEGWILRNEPIVAHHTLVEIIQQREFMFIVLGPRDKLEATWNSPLPAPFSYPYGTNHHWNPSDYKAQLGQSKGDQYLPAWDFDNDNQHLAAMSLSQAHDVIWLDKAAKSIRKTRFYAYFVPTTSNSYASDCSIFFAVVSDVQSFRDHHADAWRWLAGDANDAFHLEIFQDDNEDSNIQPAYWDAKMATSEQVHNLSIDHVVDKMDLVLVVRRPQQREVSRQPNFVVKTFESREESIAAWGQDRQQ